MIDGLEPRQVGDDPRVIARIDGGKFILLEGKDVPPDVSRTPSWSSGNNKERSIIAECRRDNLIYTGPAQNPSALCGIRASDVPGWLSGVTVSKASSVIPDWPLTCPRCKRKDSAIMLFTSMECRHGCF